MKGVFNNNPLLELYEVLRAYIGFGENSSIRSLNNEDAILKLILENNGCAFSDGARYRFKELAYTPNYTLYFIYGAKGNSVNEFYDYIEIYGMKNLIIFMDYFEDLNKSYNPSNDIDKNLQELMGNSIYFDAIKKIVDVYISTTTNAAELMGSESTTAASNMYRFAGLLIAAKIIDDTIGLTENDVSTIRYEDLRKMLNRPFEIVLLGIRVNDDE